jgi:hypothetical protein
MTTTDDQDPGATAEETPAQLAAQIRRGTYRPPVPDSADLAEEDMTPAQLAARITRR